jgi:hypothetical protein
MGADSSDMMDLKNPKNPSFGDLFKEGCTMMEEGFWTEAIPVWTEAIQLRPGHRNAIYKRAVCMFESGANLALVQTELQACVEGDLAQRYDPFNEFNDLPPVEVWLWMATVNHRLMDFDQARKDIGRFVEEAGDRHVSADLASKLIAEIQFAQVQMDNPRDMTVQKMQINSAEEDSHPVLTADGSTMFFSSSREPESGEVSGQGFRDVYVTRLGEDNVWSKPERLDLGVEKHAQVVAVDPYGVELVVEEHDGWVTDRSVSVRTEKGWAEVEALVLDKHIPNHGEVVFFPGKDRIIASVVDRKGEGGFDLYESERRGDGTWTALRPLGAEVNTWGDEITPFVAPDGHTLFYASDGLVGMGGFDVYRSVRSESGSYSIPENMGYPINSVEDDLGFVIGATGERAYLSSRRDVSQGDLDLYEVNLQEKTLERDVVVVTLRAEESQGEAIPDHLILRDAQSQNEINRIASLPGEKAFQFILETGSTYVLEAETVDVEGGASLLNVRTIDVPENRGSGVVDMNIQTLYGGDLMASNGDNGTPFVLVPNEPTRPSVPVHKSAGVREVEQDLEVEQEEGLDVSELHVNHPAVSHETPGGEVEPEKPEEPAKPEVPVLLESAFAAFISEPICELATTPIKQAQMLLAVQLHGGQVHTGRMTLEATTDHIVRASVDARPVVRVEGSASAKTRLALKSNEVLANDRVMDVYLRLRDSLAGKGLVLDKDYTMEVVRRVQPDADTPAELRGSDVPPATFQYVRVDIR